MLGFAGPASMVLSGGVVSTVQLREIIANTFGQIALIDHNVGRILIALDEIGLRDNTLVVYSSDHGDWLGDHGLILKGPMHYEGLLRVGMIARGPGIPAGKTVLDPASTLDLSATFLDCAGAPAHLAQHGRSLKPIFETTSPAATLPSTNGNCIQTAQASPLASGPCGPAMPS